jgi:aryl-phospho-beta-D-glucosidase BglC (GH1 family)
MNIKQIEAKTINHMLLKFVEPYYKNHVIKVIIDLHVAPGSQNGDEHNDNKENFIECDDSQKNIDTSLSTIDFSYFSVQPIHDLVDTFIISN